MGKKLKEWFDRDCAVLLGEWVRSNYSEFDVGAYADEVASGVPELELKARVKLMADKLRQRLPVDYEKAAAILTASLGPPLAGETGMFTQGYWLMPVARLIEDHGLNEFDTSMQLCAELTRRHTAEYAVRPYIEQDQERALKYLNNWSTSDDLHIRRLASECGRPKLPWAKKLQCFVDDPEPMLKIASCLKTDKSKYVRMSVANLINDVSKSHPDRIIELAKTWVRDGNDHTRWIVRHGTRTLQKNACIRRSLSAGNQIIGCNRFARYPCRRPGPLEIVTA